MQYKVILLCCFLLLLSSFFYKAHPENDYKTVILFGVDHQEKDILFRKLNSFIDEKMMIVKVEDWAKLMSFAETQRIHVIITRTIFSNLDYSILLLSDFLKNHYKHDNKPSVIYIADSYEEETRIRENNGIDFRYIIFQRRNLIKYQDSRCVFF